MFVKLTELYTMKSEFIVYKLKIKKNRKKKMLLSLLVNRGTYKIVML